jgi:multicomponent Na+:H+ antiporter subunit D
LWSKWYLVLGALDAQQVWLVVVLMLSSLLNIAYLLPIPFRAFFSTANGDTETAGIKEAPIACLIAIGITSVGCIVLFLFPDAVYNLLQPITGP